MTPSSWSCTPCRRIGRFNWHARERIALIGSLRHAAEAAGVRFKVSVQHGDPAGVILLHANARRADLIVLGTQRAIRLRSLPFWFSRRDRGSRGDAARIGRARRLAGKVADSTTPFKNILVAVDFGEGSSEAVERALSMANGDSRVTVVHVVRGVPLGYASRRLSHRMETEYQRHLVRDAWRRIAETIPADAQDITKSARTRRDRRSVDRNLARRGRSRCRPDPGGCHRARRHRTPDLRVDGSSRDSDCWTPSAGNTATRRAKQ